MTGAFLFSDDAPIDDARAAALSGGGVFDRHVTRWNDNCVFCHNVAPNPGRDPRSGAFETTVAELGIACEAVPRPGRASTRAPTPIRCGAIALHLGGARRSDDRQPVAPRARARAPICAGAATASASPPTSVRS